jgi:hypothetical protein
MKTIGTDQIIVSNKSPIKSNKLPGCERIARPWLYSFKVIRLWGR